MMRQLKFLIVFIGLSTFVGYAKDKNTIPSFNPQSLSLQKRSDTTVTNKRPIHFMSPTITQSRIYRMTYTSIPLFIAGGVVFNHEKEFRNMRNTHIPNFEYSYDNYLQYAPMILMLGLKACGVESRNSWGRMLTADVFSAGIMATLVNGLKYTVKKERPDHSAKNSFPSGHTATAFMAATMLHKEYGLTRSPIYSIAGYTVATATAFSRILNNRHWMSDLLFGAGIGIISTELGYYLTDLIFKDRGIKRDWLPEKEDNIDRKPSFFGLNIGYSLNNVPFSCNDREYSFKTMFGISTSLEGAWFFHKHWGIGANIGGSQSTAYLDNSLIMQNHPGLNPQETSFDNALLSTIDGGIGAYYSYPLPYGLRVMANTNFQMGKLKKNKLYMYTINANDEEEKTLYLQSSSSFTPGNLTRVSMVKMLNGTLGVSLYGEYKYAHSKIDFKYLKKLDTPDQPEYTIDHQRKNFHNWSIGGSIAAYL